MSTHIRLADLTDKALNLLKAQGLSASTLGGYTKKYEFLKKYFASLGSAYYDESLLSQFMVDYEEKHKNGTICYFYLRQWQRATRLIKEIAAEGTADLNPYVNRRKYVVSKENEAVINSILDSYNLQGIPREEVDISLRHICSYACGENDSLLNITDDHLLKFIGTEIPNSTKQFYSSSFNPLSKRYFWICSSLGSVSNHPPVPSSKTSVAFAIISLN